MTLYLVWEYVEDGWEYVEDGKDKWNNYVTFTSLDEANEYVSKKENYLFEHGYTDFNLVVFQEIKKEQKPIFENTKVRYTGGGVYVFQAELEEKRYFVTDLDFWYIYDADWAEAWDSDVDMYDFDNEHLIQEVDETELPKPWIELAKDIVRQIEKNLNIDKTDLEKQIAYLDAKGER